MSTQSYLAEKQKSVDNFVRKLREIEKEIQKNNEEALRINRKLKNAGTLELGKKQYLHNELEAVQAKNKRAADNRKAFGEGKKKADALLAEAKEIAKDPAGFKRKYQGLVNDAQQRASAFSKEIGKNNAKIQEFQRDYDRAGTLDIAAKGYIRDRQKALRSKNEGLQKSIREQNDRKKGFEAKIALVDKITAAGFAGWGVAALGGLFVAANL